MFIVVASTEKGLECMGKVVDARRKVEKTNRLSFVEKKTCAHMEQSHNK